MQSEKDYVIEATTLKHLKLYDILNILLGIGESGHPATFG